MKPNPKYLNLDSSFWAHVKLISEGLGYSERKKRGADSKKLKRYSFSELVLYLKKENLSTSYIQELRDFHPTPQGELLVEYLNYRADSLEAVAMPNLMDRDQASTLFNELKTKLQPSCHLPMNKQKHEKRHNAYLTGIVNMLTEAALEGKRFDDDPRGLAIATNERIPIMTFSRWMDGAYPNRVDPIALWEVKEYYGTTTFGSRVADGVYETLLDGYELAEFKQLSRRNIFHYLIVDDRFTWWDCGRSYLCRIVDMVHAGFVDEVLFGKEVVFRWSEIVRSWP